ncbi:MAG: hypothetical protein RI556_12695, partial [Hydrogenovibrio sp.]|uniref:hypothetical protein n=1 Tax=Hydrogenovibrio sp. TaxID=2065821 RepID=UPI0028702D3D
MQQRLHLQAGEPLFQHFPDRIWVVQLQRLTNLRQRLVTDLQLAICVKNADGFVQILHQVSIEHQLMSTSLHTLFQRSQ